MKQTPQEIVQVVTAFMNGEKIEFSQLSDTDEQRWREIETPNWDFQCFRYRVKQPQKPSIKWEEVNKNYKWLAKDENGSCFLFTNEPKFNVVFREWTEFEYMPANVFTSLFVGDCAAENSLVKRPD